ncbi:type III secretion system gatekeeper subunit SctW [Allochromatium palmeri]|uniref:YopN family type III secretion system gatekeeper subunit n=1 Tax=Allochromatium palmeri TaxID=231048 RepID=A0A6N8EIC7_9GAMM|nr:type III secretion system gatekeeper subunit SctW [Allochromatium palmeri]MTW22476.1 YopN family type III secretion system gatekeeper subunit [Allochromatium palmeri]
MSGSGSIQADLTNLAGLRSDRDAPLTTGGHSEGQYRGERVVLGDERSLLQDAAEEMTFQHGESEEKTLARRTISDAAKQKKGLAMLRVKQVMDKLPDLRKNNLERVMQILMRLRHAESFDLRHQVREQFREPSHQYAALLAFAERLREEGAPASQIAMAERALRELEAEQGPAIRAALNIADVADAFSRTQLGDLQTLRATYRDAVLDASGLSETFNTLKDRHGDSELLQAIKYLLKALAADLGADGPSIDPAKLSVLLNDLYRLELLTGLLEDCATLVERYRTPGCAFKPSDLLGELLALQVQTWLRPESITPLPGKLGVREIAQEIGFLREFRELARSIPLKAYADCEQRPRLLDAIQQAMDSAIEREDEEGY